MCKVAAKEKLAAPSIPTLSLLYDLLRSEVAEDHAAMEAVFSLFVLTRSFSLTIRSGYGVKIYQFG